MRPSMKFVLLLAALLLTILVLPRTALAASANCPTEPKTDQPIASGDVYAGANCTLHTPGDIDTFVFSADAGDTWQIVAAFQGGGTNICIALYDPTNKKIFPTSTQQINCTYNGNYDDAVDTQTLNTTGQYTIEVTEFPGGPQVAASYALSLERISPFPPDAKPIILSTSVNGAIAPPTDQNVFTFYGATTGTYQVSLTFVSGTTNACMYLYLPGSAIPAKSPDQGCTYNGNYETYSFQFTPAQDATYMVLVNGSGNAGTVDYVFEISCVIGNCPTLVPTTTALTSSPNPSGDGLAVTFTAAVTSSDGAPPNGESVYFMNGKTILGSGKLTSGKATFSDSKLTPGATTSVTAVYPGDAKLLGSTSNTVRQLVYGPCTLIDSLSYNGTSKTLTMKFTVGSTVATAWNVWLTYQNSFQELFSTPQSITDPPNSVTKTTALSAEGAIGVLSTLTTPTNGIYCSSYQQVNTGTP